MSDDNELFDSLKFGEFDEAAIAMHETFESFLSAGFSDDQAFQLTRTVLAAHIQGSYLA